MEREKPEGEGKNKKKKEKLVNINYEFVEDIFRKLTFNEIERN